ncbi:MAG: VanZ family protein [Halobacteriales archaeon]|nr:VanZ family protein [Halobacteriales archaeon]
MKKRRILFAVAVVAVVAASLVSDPYLPTADFVPGVASDKVWHAVGYFCLTLVALYVFDQRPLVVAVGVVLLGAGVELAQSFVPYRTASLLDMAANTVGVVFAVAVASFVPTD